MLLCGYDASAVPQGFILLASASIAVRHVGFGKRGKQEVCAFIWLLTRSQLMLLSKLPGLNEQ